MTPLARALAEAAVTNPKWWRESGNEKLLAPFPNDVKCFEVSQVSELAYELADQAQARGNVAESLAFLPAPVTWIERRYTRKDGKSALQSYLLVEKGDKTASVVNTIGVEIKGKTIFIPADCGDLQLLDSSDPDGFAIDSAIIQQSVDPISHAQKVVGGLYRLRDAAGYVPDERDNDDELETAQGHSWWLYSVLSLINSPRIVGRSEHKVSSGLNKFLARKRGAPYQLLPWHEIFLDISPPPEAELGSGTRLTGPRALHFCRQHIRIKRGRLEMVRAHYRGNPEVGIARSRYAVGTAERDSAA